MRTPDYRMHARATPVEAMLFRFAGSHEPLLEGLTRWHISKEYVLERARAGKGVHALVRSAMDRLNRRCGGREKWRYTKRHSVEVARFVYIMAREAQEQGGPEARGLDPKLVFVGGLVHDIGKTFLPLAIMVKELGIDFGIFTAFRGARLSEVEKSVLRNEHIATGTRHIRLFGKGGHIRVLLDMTGLHHVNFNGKDSGVPSYPSLVRGADLPFHSRIAKTADLISAAMPRHYRSNGYISSVDDSLAHAISVAGVEVDPRAVECFITGHYDVGPEKAGRLIRRLAHPGGEEALLDVHRARAYAKEVVRTDPEFTEVVGKRSLEKAERYGQELRECYLFYGIEQPAEVN